MKIGISQLIAPPDWTIDEFFRQSAAAGYEVVELSLRPRGPIHPEVRDAELRRIADLSESQELPIVSLTINHLTGNLLDSGDAQRLGIEQTVFGLQVAAKLGARHALHTLGRLRADLYYDDAYRNAVSALRELAPTCRDLQVRLAIEFVWNGFLFSPLEMRRFLDEVDSDDVGFYFDPGNMAVFQHPHHWVRIVGPRTFLVHLKDWKGNALSGGWPPLTEGDVDFAAINRELRALGYDGPLVSEVPLSVAPLDATARAIRRIISM